MPRGRKRIPGPELPPKGHYRAYTLPAMLMREGVISPTEFALFQVVTMLTWQGQPMRITEQELACWVGISREWAGKILTKLTRIGIIIRTDDGRICVNSNSCELQTSLPPHPPNMVVVDISLNQVSDKPPPPDDDIRGQKCEAQFTQIPVHVNSNSQKIHPALMGLAKKVGVIEVDKLAKTGMGPRRLWSWWRSIERAGGGVGAFVNRLQDSQEFVPQIPRFYTGPDFCPSCGAEITVFILGQAPEQCENCGTRLRLCECGELAPQAGACPWCGLREQAV